MGVWLDRAIIGTIIVVGMFIMYRGLKEPLDLLFGAIKKGVIGIKNAMADRDTSGGYEVIRYG